MGLRVPIHRTRPYHQRIFDAGDGLYPAPALRAFESIIIPDLLHENCPLVSPAPSFVKMAAGYLTITTLRVS